MGRDDEFAAGPYDLSAPPDWERFPGLYPPLYTQTPDVFFDWVAPFLPEIELRVLLYLIRRTLGFKKQGDQITIDQIAGGIITREGTRLDWGARLGERSVQRALAGLEEKGLIERHRQLDPERGWRPSYIRLRLCDQWGQAWQSRGRQPAHLGVGLDTREVSVETSPRRQTRHQPGVPLITPSSQESTVRPDTYKKQRSHSTVEQETVVHPPQQETESTAPGTPSGMGNGHIANGHTGETTALWERIKEELAAVLAPAVYSTRVAGTSEIVLPCANGEHGAVLTVRCPDAASSRWLEHRLGRMIAEIAAGLVDDPPTIRFTTSA